MLVLKSNYVMYKLIIGRDGLGLAPVNSIERERVCQHRGLVIDSIVL